MRTLRPLPFCTQHSNVCLRTALTSRRWRQDGARAERRLSSWHESAQTARRRRHRRPGSTAALGHCSAGSGAASTCSYHVRENTNIAKEPMAKQDVHNSVNCGSPPGCFLSFTKLTQKYIPISHALKAVGSWTAVNFERCSRCEPVCCKGLEYNVQQTIKF